MKPWVLTKQYSEGKYLVVRRDGTIPAWPHFVLSADDPATIAALEAYAKATLARAADLDKAGQHDKAAQLSLYAGGVQELAHLYENRQFSDRTTPAVVKAVDPQAKACDPEAGPHRVDNPHIVEMMRGRGDLSRYAGPPAHVPPAGQAPGNGDLNDRFTRLGGK